MEVQDFVSWEKKKKLFKWSILQKLHLFLKQTVIMCENCVWQVKNMLTNLNKMCDVDMYVIKQYYIALFRMCGLAFYLYNNIIVKFIIKYEFCTLHLYNKN